MCCIFRMSSIVNVIHSTNAFSWKNVYVLSVRGFARDIDLPRPDQGKNYRRIVHYPEEYTVKPLDVTNLGGRDPVSGRKIVNCLGGGIKHKYHWLDLLRIGPKEGPPLVEKVFHIIVDGNRTAHVALVGRGDHLRYVLATENMKAGDLIKTSGQIPRIPVRANEGDAYPLGALQVGTLVHCVEKYPGHGGEFAKSAGTFCTIIRRVGDRVIVQVPSKREMSLSQECMAVVGRVSNLIHNKIPIGSPQNLRLLGYRPRSGLWHRKEGRHGRKIRPPPPVRVFDKPPEKEPPPLQMTMQYIC